jgi:hypothetical protein
METYELLEQLEKQRHTYRTMYAIERNDGKVFPERYATRQQAQEELDHKLGNGATYGLAWIVELHQTIF